jgi:hypothetical protein
MTLDELEKRDAIAQGWFRRLLGVVFFAYFAVVIAGTILAFFPPHLSSWAHFIATRSAAQAARHGNLREPWHEEEILLLLRALIAVAWSSVAVLGVGAIYGFRATRRRVNLTL